MNTSDKNETQKPTAPPLRQITEGRLTEGETLTHQKNLDGDEQVKPSKPPPSPTKPEKKKVDKINFTKPFYVVVYQTDARTFTKPFHGGNAERLATEYATDRAMEHGTTAAIFGPQTTVLAPPKPSEPESVKLSWVPDFPNT